MSAIVFALLWKAAHSLLCGRYMGTAWRSVKEAADFLFSSVG